MASCGCTLSRQQLRHLNIHTPRWRLIISLRSITALVACLTIAAFAICIAIQLSVAQPLAYRIDGNNNDAWQWGDVWIESFAFVPPAVSLLQTVVTIPYLLSTTHLTHPAMELVIEGTLVLIAAFPIVFCATVSGPLQRWQSNGSSSSHLIDDDELAGVMELIGFIGLCLLEIFHFGFFIWACRRMHVRRRNKVAMARAAATKLEAGWGASELEGAGVGLPFKQPETREEEEVRQPRPELVRQVNDIMTPPSPAELRRAREDNAPLERQSGGGARRPSSISALSSRWGRMSGSWGRRPSSLDGYMREDRRRTQVSQIGVAIGKPQEVWMPITQMKSESPITPHRVVEDHEVVIVGEGEVKVVSTPREEAFVGWSIPEPVIPRPGGEKKDPKKEAETDEEATMVTRSPDPDIPAPLKVRKSVKSFKAGNSWEIEEKLQTVLPVADQGW